MVVAGLDFFRGHPRPVHLRHAPLEFEDILRRGVGHVDTGVFENRGDMRLVLWSDSGHAAVVPT